MTDSSHSSAPSVLVVGGGLAGLAAAVPLAQAGLAVQLIETRQRLGGRATSFTDPTTGDTLDNCQHVMMRCCTFLTDFYQRLGVLDTIAWHRRFTFADGSGAMDCLQADPLPAPLHLGRRMMGFRTLGLRDKLCIARGMWAILRTGIQGRQKLGDVDFRSWLARHGQSERAITRFWAPVIVSACNQRIEAVPVSTALQVFQEGFLAQRQAYEMGLATRPLVHLYDPAAQIITQAGGSVQSSTSVRALHGEASRITAVQLADGSCQHADWFVSAVPFDRLDKLTSDTMKANDQRLQTLDRFDVSPIIGVHLFYALDVREADPPQPRMAMPHLALMESDVDWFFHKGVVPMSQSGLADLAGSTPDQPVEHLHAVISAAGDWVNLPAQEILDRTAAELARMVPAYRGLKPLHGRVVKEKRATFALALGIDALRPDACPGPGDHANLLIAGDWTASGWPATMEGAVRSGYRCAAHILRACGRHGEAAQLQVSDLKPDWPYRLLAAR